MENPVQARQRVVLAQGLKRNPAMGVRGFRTLPQKVHPLSPLPPNPHLSPLPPSPHLSPPPPNPHPNLHQVKAPNPPSSA